MVPTVIVEEATGDVSAVDPGIDKTIAVIGCSETGTDGSIALYGTPAGVYAGRGNGPGQRLAGAILKANPADALVVSYKAPSTNVGTFGTPDVSGVIGTALPVFSGPPLDLYQLHFIVTDDGNDGGGTAIGVDGIRYQRSTDAARTPEGPFSLGTAEAVVFPGTGATLTFNPVAATLVAPANALRAAALLHFPKTSSSIHGAADTTSDDGIGAVCTTNANAVTLINALRVAILLHLARGSTVHTTADITSGVDIPIAAVTQQDALVLLDALIEAFNLHIVNLSYHGASDVADAVAVPTLLPGTLKTGDVITVSTVAPAPSADDVTAAFIALGGSAQNFGLVACAFPCSAAMSAVVSAGMDYLNSRGKRVGGLVRIRNMAVGETEQQWVDSVNTDYAAFTDDRIVKSATPSRCTIDDGIRVRVFDTDCLHVACARLVGYDLVKQSPGEVGLGALEGVAITDTAGTLLATSHDEGGDIQGLDGAHFLALHRLPDPTRARGVYFTWPWVAYEVGVDRVQTIMTRRVANKGERIMAAVGFGELGSAKTYIPGTVPGTGALSVPAANIIKQRMIAPLQAAGGLKYEISNPDDPDLVTVDRNVTVDGEKVYVVAFLNLVSFKYVGKITITLNVIQ